MIKKKYKESEKFKNPNILVKILKWYCQNLFLGRLIALITVLNLGIVFFDISYIPLRDFWLLGNIHLGKFEIGNYSYEGIKLRVVPKTFSNIILKYDLVKGISPYRDTNNYLEKIDQLEKSINNNGLDSIETREILLNLRQKSIDMITENPFELAGKTGTLEKIKNIMRNHIKNENNSSKDAFRTFFTAEYLKDDTENKLAFFKKEITPLINTNYFRPYAETGGFVDYFAVIDFPFFVIITMDFLARSLYLSFRYTGINWFDGMLWRWYDLIFLFPLYRWLRIIPVIIRLDQTKLINLQAIKKQSSQGFVATIATDVTEVVIIRVINQLQNSIEDGNIETFLSSQNNRKQYIDLNNTNEISEILKLIIQLTTYQVLPKIKPEVELLLQYLIENSIKETPVFRNIQSLPMMKSFPQKFSLSLASQIYQLTLDIITNLVKEDAKFDLYLKQILTKFRETITSEISAKDSVEKIEVLLHNLLEEIKINYVQNLSDQDFYRLLEETKILQQDDFDQ